MFHGLGRLAGVLAVAAGVSVVAALVGIDTGSEGVGAPGQAFAKDKRSERGQFQGPQSIAPVAEKLIDAVVNISTTQVQRGPSGVPLPRVPSGSPFEEFFEEFFDKRGEGAGPARKLSSLGSGFVIDGKAGLIVTNHHVIADADEIVINFNDGSILKVDRVVGIDLKTDLALLKVSPKSPLAEVNFGRSRDMRVGDWVMAIGNPFGLGGSVTVGIISAKQRDIKSGPYDEYLQTDASINKGNSGGPLFNMDGEVIGINTAILSPTGASVGIGFAVPSNTAVSIVAQLRAHGEVRRGWLGVKIQSVREEIAKSLGVAANAGALVSLVEPGSPAEVGGIRGGDVILKFDGVAVSNIRKLPALIARTQVGKTVSVELFSNGVAKTVKVTIGRLREDSRPSRARVGEGQNENLPRDADQFILGMKLSPLDDALRAKFRLGTKIRGVVVVEIDPSSDAAKQSIVVGNVIVEAGQEKVSGPGDVLKSIAKVRRAGRSAVLLWVESSKGELRSIAVPIMSR